MRTFREYFEDGEHLRDYERVALLAGGFKPPHKGHLEMFNGLLGDADRGVIFVGKKQDREGRKWITPEASKAIWEIYTQGDKPVEVHIAPISPVTSTYEFVEDNPTTQVIIGSGPEDAARNEGFKNKEKYPNAEVRNSKEALGGGIRASKLAPLLKDGNIKEAVEKFVPDFIEGTNRDAVIDILQKDWDNR